MGALFTSLVILAIIILSKILPKKNFEKNHAQVYGRIINYVIEDGKHYPIFQFETKDGRLIEARNTTYLEELSVEDAYTDEASEFLKKNLPIEHILIYYIEKNPEDFIPVWIDK